MRWFAAVFLLVACLAQAGDRRVQLWHAPAFVNETDRTTYEVRVPIHAGNRLVALAAFDGDVRVSYGEHWLTDDGPALCDFTWQLPAGELVLVAVLYSDGGEIARDSRPLVVFGRLQ